MTLIEGGQDEPRSDAEGALLRETQAMRDSASVIKPLMSVLGVCMVSPTIVIGCILIWYSTRVPESCNTPLRDIFLSLGITYLVIVLLTGLVIVFMGHAFVDFTVRMQIVERFKRDGLEAEAKSEEEAGQKEIITSAFHSCPLMCGILIAGAVVSCLWIFGMVSAAKVKGHSCGNAVEVFWVLFVIFFVFQCIGQSFAKYPMPLTFPQSTGSP
mmetsp:Transcript_30901/g.67695  ORF Transcript_30901/g.67695 Transcript_30901/m.67695 type:complete len:213 (-) Transcript_30901:178-816(-)|eukprot:CAMPEP_0170579358 /NCGR_PEP_ID=MMETSP0224-20130122/5942_1 /TAXON_ID=285029 /ORGANISM="Togula jolla, Strain CCCM 725" /LENGTH=212 /DNA_ID=CAMNT_0010902379 /DNA_START=21 /DNA_END=659 /DNA_ORIENTATION=+